MTPVYSVYRWVHVVGEPGHYLNRPADFQGSVLELIRTFRDQIEASNYAGWTHSGV
jgi:hypothetical protein